MDRTVHITKPAQNETKNNAWVVWAPETSIRHRTRQQLFDVEHCFVYSQNHAEQTENIFDLPQKRMNSYRMIAVRSNRWSVKIPELFEPLNWLQWFCSPSQQMSFFEERFHHMVLLHCQNDLGWAENGRRPVRSFFTHFSPYLTKLRVRGSQSRQQISLQQNRRLYIYSRIYAFLVEIRINVGLEHNRRDTSAKTFTSASLLICVFMGLQLWCRAQKVVANKGSQFLETFVRWIQTELIIPLQFSKCYCRSLNLYRSAELLLPHRQASWHFSLFITTHNKIWFFYCNLGCQSS